MAKKNQKPLQMARYQFKAMGSLCQLWFYHSQASVLASAFLACQNEALRFEKQYSRFLSDSLIGQLNLGKSIEVSPECAALLHYAQVAYQQSQGLFDISAGILKKAWDFNHPRLPQQKIIDQLLEKVGWEKVLSHNHLPFANENNPLKPEDFQNDRFSLPPGMAIDLGGIVKEYAADALCGLAKSFGIFHGLIDLAGDITALGPHPNDAPWIIKIKHPRLTGRALAKIELKTGAIASSGDYERYVMINGQRYCHIINPITGWPVRGTAAVSVAAPLCIIAGTMATTAMLMGEQKAHTYLQSAGVSYVLEPDSKTPLRANQ